MARSTRVTWHWVCIEDEDLDLILSGPDMESEDGLHEYIDAVIDIIEDGLETA